MYIDLPILLVGTTLTLALGWMTGYRKGWRGGYGQGYAEASSPELLEEQLNTLIGSANATVTLDGGKPEKLTDVLAELVKRRKEEEDHHDHDDRTRGRSRNRSSDRSLEPHHADRGAKARAGADPNPRR